MTADICSASQRRRKAVLLKDEVVELVEGDAVPTGSAGRNRQLGGNRGKQREASSARGKVAVVYQHSPADSCALELLRYWQQLLGTWHQVLIKKLLAAQQRTCGYDGRFIKPCQIC